MEWMVFGLVISRSRAWFLQMICEVSGMRIYTSKSGKARVWDLLLQMEAFVYLGVLFMSKGTVK